MSEERVHHVTVSLVRDYEFLANFDDVAAAPPMRLDEPPPLGDAADRTPRRC
jgi:hypothetical protein